MYAGIHLSEWRYWELGHKATFDGTNRLIKLAPGVTELSVKTDLYSDWKEWMSVDDNSKYITALRTVGGDPISDTEQLGDSYFLTNNWKIQPWNGSYTLNIDGNLYVDNAGVPSATATLDPFVPTTESSNVKIQSTVSTLVNTVIQTQDVPALTDEQLAIITNTLVQATAAATDAGIARKLGTNRAVISGDGTVVTIYDDDDISILRQFAVTADGNNDHTREPI